MASSLCDRLLPGARTATVSKATTASAPRAGQMRSLGRKRATFPYAQLAARPHMDPAAFPTRVFVPRAGRDPIAMFALLVS